MRFKETLYQAPDVDLHLLESKFVAQTFHIRVVQPASRIGGSERFPVVYATDSDDFLGGFATLAKSLQFHGETPRFILVGIGYENARTAAVSRMRDFLTSAIRARFQSNIQQFTDSPWIGGVVDLEQVTQTTGAAEFLQFIRDELRPLVAARYPVIPGDDTYFGYSAGGAFGLYTLFTQPDTFKRYVLGSPATSYDGEHFGIELVESFLATRRPMSARVFMSVGELEEFKSGFGKFDLVSGWALLAKFLKQAAIPGLDLTLQIFPGETHATAWAAAFSRGLKAVLGPVEAVPFWPTYMQPARRRF